MWISNILTVGMTRQHTFPSVNPKTGEFSSGILVSVLALFWSAATFVLVGMRELVKMKNKMCKLQNYLFVQKLTLLIYAVVF